MTGTVKEADKETLRKIMSEPTIKAVREASIRENRKREKDIVDMLRETAARD